MRPIELPSVSHFRNRNGWLGSAGELRFQLETPVEVFAPGEDENTPKDEEAREYTVTAVLWQGPFSRPYAQELERCTFPVTEEGRAALLAWLDGKAADMEANPVFTAEELQACYLRRKQEEAEAKDAASRG